MLAEICRYLRNWFDRGQVKLYGVIRILDGAVSPTSYLIDEYNHIVTFGEDRLWVADDTLGATFRDVLQDGQHFRIIGSVFNDGVHVYPATDLHDEVFNGSIWAMAVPPEILALDAEIAQWCTDHAAALNSPYQSESFGGYSYNLGYNGGSAQSASWQNQFAARLAPWRKI